LINLASRERLRGILRILETEKMNEILIVYPDGVNPQIAAAVAKYLLYLCVGKFMQAQ
jgi:predicted metal-dependent peptidase